MDEETRSELLNRYYKEGKSSDSPAIRSASNTGSVGSSSRHHPDLPESLPGSLPVGRRPARPRSRQRHVRHWTLAPLPGLQVSRSRSDARITPCMISHRQMGADKGRTYELERCTVKCMRGILFCYMRQSDKVSIILSLGDGEGFRGNVAGGAVQAQAVRGERSPRQI